MPKSFNFYSDPGHGWLRVGTEWLVELGIYEAVSEFSYVSDSGKWVYLEEDLDAQMFISAYTVTQLHRPVIDYKEPSYNASSIRRYRPYSEDIKSVLREYADRVADSRA